MRQNNERGFTLVELIVGIAIMAIILGGTAVILSSASQAQTYNMNKGTNMYDANNALNRIAEELQYAYARRINIADNKAQGDAAHTGSDYYTLPVETSELYFARGVEGGTKLESRHIYLENNKIVMDYAAYPQNAIPWTVTKTVELTSGKVKSLNFEIEEVPDDDIDDIRAKRKKFTITITVSGNSAKASEEITYTTEVITNNTVLD